MAYSDSFGLVSLALLTGCLCSLGACSSTDHPPGSLVSAGGESAQGGGSTGSGGHGEAGQTGHDGGSPSDSDAGAAGEPPIGTPSTPFAVYVSTLEADVGCDGSTPDASFLIRNGGASVLSVVSASADSGYVVKTKLPLSIAPDSAVVLLITPPAPANGAQLGDMRSGTLSFSTNEPDMPTHQVTLNTALFGAHLELTDHDGVPLTTALPLTYLTDGSCPDTVKYRVHNTGNAAVTLSGPTFPANFSGTSTDSGGQSIGPDEYVELLVSGTSTPGNVCSANGALTFTTKGPFCGSLPTLNVTWPAPPVSSASCTCPVLPPAP